MIKFYGTNWCGDCRGSKQILDSLQAPYEYVDIESNPEAADLVRELNDGMASVPTIVFDDAQVMTEPSADALKLKLKSIGFDTAD